MYRRHILVTGLTIAGALAGCAGDDDESGGTDQTGGTGAAGQAGGTGAAGQTDDTGGTTQTSDTGGTELTGVETYSGEWSGSIGTDSYSGVWQFEADFDNGEVTGWFEGGGTEGNITGTISGGEIDAEGTAGFGAVEWSGEFGSGGQVSGTWELAEVPSQGGEWSGSVGELPEQPTATPGETETEEAPPQSDVQGSDIEDVPRYPDSVRILYAVDSSTSPPTTGIRYTTEATFEEVYAFYESALEDEGWRIRQRKNAKDGGFVAVKGSTRVVIGWEPNSDYEGYLDIIIAYTGPT